ncbi:MAG: hypothetical protein K2P78_00670, partial [Gemmataceae bacterium]|nr:hypothetical protein [Gemmataceae bacterium]
MVARNQHGGSGGWDDLPPRILDRIRPAGSAAAVGVASPPTHPSRRPGWLRDVSRLAFVFLLVAVLNLFVLLLALW